MQNPPVQLNPRRQTLLEIIVTDYIVTASPVASQQVVRRHNLKVSPATIRNDMAELEEMGYLSRPHTSAGGIPSDPAYRFYVERTQRRARPPKQLEELVQKAIHAEDGDPDEWAREAAGVLSTTVQNVAITTAPRAFKARVKQVQLVQLQDRQALLILVMQEARVRQRMVQFPGHVSQEALSDVALQINNMIPGKTGAEIRVAWDNSSLAGPITDPVMNEVLHLLKEEERDEPQRHYMEGLRHMLGQPEFENGLRAREAVEILEDDIVLRRFFVEASEHDGVEVVIGAESQDEQLKPYSVVVARYGLPDKTMGVVGAVGPTRMDYTRAIASVRYMAEFLNELLLALEDAKS
ncbi:MAG: heat-inducible transcriptional repressor HrcA [Dehalococcoidia bacterium]